MLYARATPNCCLRGQMENRPHSRITTRLMRAGFIGVQVQRGHKFVRPNVRHFDGGQNDLRRGFHQVQIDVRGGGPVSRKVTGQSGESFHPPLLQEERNTLTEFDRIQTRIGWTTNVFQTKEALETVSHALSLDETEVGQSSAVPSAKQTSAYHSKRFVHWLWGGN